MISKIKIFYNDNKVWMYLGKYILISFLLAVGAILIDIRFIPILDYIPAFLMTSVDLAQSILGTLSGSLLTITTFTFSTIMVVLTMYSSNFSPRVVNNFLTDKITMKVLGIFVGGFFYCIIALFFMKESYADYLVISATIAVIYSVLCVIYFVIFVYNVSSSIQATKLISRLYDESSEIIERTLKNRENHLIVDLHAVGEFKSELEIISDTSGYLEFVEFKEILNTLKDMESKFIIKIDIGDFVSKNQVIAILYYNEDLKDEELMANLIKSFSIEEERIAYNDYRFSLQKIIDIALRAMSPGINDPNTSIHCINILGVLLSKLSEIKGEYTIIKDENSKSQIVYEDFHFKEDLYSTFYQIVHYGKKDISIVLSIFNALKTISMSSSNDKIVIIKEFSDYIYQNSINNFNHEFDLEMLKKAQESI
ncbi:MAG: DUF2254 domain-containing protein [Clostridiales bacterium]|nr:DUF2254 domain-containing protein [Clostridiales bacterium]